MLEVEVDLGEVKSLLKQIERRGKRLPLRRAAVVMHRSVMRNFQAGGRPTRWPKLKSRKGRPLQDTGFLKKSVQHRIIGSSNVKVYSKHPHAAYHQEGTGIHGKRGTMIPIYPKKEGGMLRFPGKAGGFVFARMVMNPGVPKRPFIMWQKSDVRDIERMLVDWLDRGR